MKNILILAGAALLMGACGKNPNDAAVESWKAPSSWYAMDEDKGSEPLNDATEADLAPHVDSLFEAQGNAVEEATADAGDSENLAGTGTPASSGVAPLNLAPSSKGKPADWVPWHAEYLIADLALSASGVLGGLTGKGTATEQAFWRRQYTAGKKSAGSPAAVTAPPSMRDMETSSVPVVDSTSTDDQLDAQISPAVEAIAATSKVKDKNLLRRKIRETTTYFYSMMEGFDQNPGLTWWVSRFRMDFTVDASGKVTPTIAAGGEVKLRLEWHRMMKKPGKPANVQAQAPLPGNYAQIRGHLHDFIKNMAQDLETMSDDAIKVGSFKAYNVRVGVGIGVGGTVGIAKASASAVAMVYFTNDTPRPQVHSKPKIELTDSASEDVAIIETRPSTMHLNYANLRGVNYEQGDDSVVYKVNRKAFRKGMQKAFKMARFFAKRAEKNQKNGHWKLFELRTLFDFSLTGDAKLVTVSGLGQSEIDFYNEKF